VSDLPLSVAEALAVIRQGGWPHGNSLALLNAANIVMEMCEHDDSITLSDMLRLLDHPDSISGEMGARALYVRTGRDNLGWKTPDNVEAFVTDKIDWIKWLSERGLLHGRKYGDADRKAEIE
jgi:hypothetical protein